MEKSISALASSTGRMQSLPPTDHRQKFKISSSLSSFCSSSSFYSSSLSVCSRLSSFFDLFRCFSFLIHLTVPGYTKLDGGPILQTWASRRGLSILRWVSFVRPPLVKGNRQRGTKRRRRCTSKGAARTDEESFACASENPRHHCVQQGSALQWR